MAVEAGTKDSCIKSFPPIIDENARILVLGSMPGVASLDAAQYYAHPRNLFWSMIGVDPAVDYQEKIIHLQQASIALWDVLYTCVRAGSLDSNIKDEMPNDIAGLLQNHPNIVRICFNGRKAEQLFHRYIKIAPHYELVSLPSTSPANASVPFEAKWALWKKALQS